MIIIIIIIIITIIIIIIITIIIIIIIIGRAGLQSVRGRGGRAELATGAPCSARGAN